MQAILLMIHLAAQEYNVPEWIMREIMYVESGGDMYAINVNTNGTIDRGVWQLNDKAHPIVDAFNLKASTFYVARYLRYLYRHCGHDWKNAVMAYNVGIGKWKRGVRHYHYVKLIFLHDPTSIYV